MSIIQLFSSMSAEQAASALREDLNSFVRAELERAFSEALDGEIEEGMRRGVRFEVVETISEAGFVAFGKGRFHVSLLRIPEGDVEIDLHVQRGGIAQRDGEEEDEGEDPIQFGGFRADRLGEGLRRLQPQREAGEVHAQNERRGEKGNGLQCLKGRGDATRESCNSHKQSHIGIQKGNDFFWQYIINNFFQFKLIKPHLQTRDDFLRRYN